jgi:long-chain acyl-CoA synthetase
MTVLSLATILAESARKRPDKVALIDHAGGRTTYAELWAQARSWAAGLRELGVSPDDTVALQIPNLPDFPRAYYGALAVGAKIVPVHLLLTPEEMAYVLRDSGASLLVAHPSQLESATKAAELAGITVVSTERLAEAAASVEPLHTYVTREAEDVAVIFYTSGTTGQPKGALLTHLNLVMNATVNTFDVHDPHPEDISMGCLPLFHTFGQSVAMNGTFRSGGTLVLLPRFTGEAAIELMVRTGATIFYGVPTMFIGLLEAAEKADRLPDLRLTFSGGASLPVAVLEKFTELFQAPIYEGYGLSETSPTATTNQPAFGTKPGTIGHPIWGVEVEIARADVDESIEFLPVGELGEIVIRGHCVFAGYHNRPEATAEALVDGWFRSGDLGRKDENGFITVVDRKKDLVIRGGYNVYPREVEEVLATHPAVAMCAVFGVSDETHGQEIMAVVTLMPESEASGEDLVAYVREHVAAYKFPRRVEVLDALPLGPSGKVLKRELVARFELV